MRMAPDTSSMNAGGPSKWMAVGPAPEQWLGGGTGWWPGRAALLLQDLAATKNAPEAARTPDRPDLLQAPQGVR